MSKPNPYASWKKIAALITIIFSPSSLGLAFTPTEGEWASWGDMCRARYVVSGAGIGSTFEHRIPKSESERWRIKLGDRAWNPLHHYCAGLVLDRRKNFKRAIAEYAYTFRAIPEEHFLYAEISARMAYSSYNLGDTANSRRYAKKAIDTHPKSHLGYVVKSIIEKKKGNLPLAIQTLEYGFKMTDGTSPELNYHLGHAHFIDGSYEKATEYAKLAYGGGYPLPWLKEQLIEKGYW